MARIITKELAEKIAAKLKAAKVKSRSKSHDFYDVCEPTADRAGFPDS